MWLWGCVLLPKHELIKQQWTARVCLQVYGEVAKEVAPKRAKLKAAQDNLAKKQAQLATAQAKLAEVLAAVQALKDRYDESTANKKALEEELSGLELKLERAEKLVTGLAGEKARWEASIADLETRVANLPVRAPLATNPRRLPAK